MVAAPAAGAMSGSGETQLVSQGYDITLQYVCVNRTLRPCELVEEFITGVEERTNGQVTVNLSSYPELGISGFDMIRLINDGTVEFGEIYSGFVAGDFPIFNITDIWGLADSPEQYLEMVEAVREDLYRIVTRESGGQVVFRNFYPSQYFYSKRPLNNIEDFQGMKTRVHSPVLVGCADFRCSGQPGWDGDQAIGPNFGYSTTDRRVSGAAGGSPRFWFGGVQWYCNSRGDTRHGRRSAMRWFALWLCVGTMGLLGMVGCGIAISDDGGTKVETRQNDFAVSGMLTLIVENANGDVAVTGGADAGRVQVTARLRRPERLEYQAVQEGNTVRITVKKRREGQNWWSWLRRQSGASDIVVAVPSAASLDIHSSNGDISARRVAGTVSLGTSNGNIEASGGDGAYDLRSSNGNITVAAGRGEFSLHTSNGNIRFAGDPEEGTENRLRTSNGNIKAQLDGESPSVRVSASTSNGSIRLERSVAVSELKGKNRLEGVIGDGAAEMTLTTSNGTVTIE